METGAGRGARKKISERKVAWGLTLPSLKLEHNDSTVQPGVPSWTTPITCRTPPAMPFPSWNECFPGPHRLHGDSALSPAVRSAKSAGMVLGTALGWATSKRSPLAIALAFVSGYALTMVRVLRVGYGFRAATRLALAADTGVDHGHGDRGQSADVDDSGAMDASSTRGSSGAAWAWRWPSPVSRLTRSTAG